MLFFLEKHPDLLTATEILDCVQRSYLPGQVVGDTLAGTWPQKSGSIDSGSHLSFYPDGQKYGSDSNQTPAALPQGCLAPF